MLIETTFWQGALMTKSPQRKPTDAELEILAVLWEHGPSTVRQVHDRLEPAKGVGYTTVLKLMQIMFDKGLLERDDSQKSHIYRAKSRQDATQKQLVKDLLHKAFGGQADKLVMQALSASRRNAMVANERPAVGATSTRQDVAAQLSRLADLHANGVALERLGHGGARVRALAVQAHDDRLPPVRIAPDADRNDTRLFHEARLMPCFDFLDGRRHLAPPECGGGGQGQR